MTKTFGLVALFGLASIGMVLASTPNRTQKAPALPWEPFPGAGSKAWVTQKTIAGHTIDMWTFDGGGMLEIAADDPSSFVGYTGILEAKIHIVARGPGPLTAAIDAQVGPGLPRV